MKINKNFDLALTLIDVLKNKTEVVRVSDLAKQIGTSEMFLQQIVRKLRQGGILTVKKGPKGGIALKSTPFSLSTYDVAQALGYSLFSPLALDARSLSHRLRESLLKAYME